MNTSMVPSVRNDTSTNPLPPTTPDVNTFYQVPETSLFRNFNSIIGLITVFAILGVTFIFSLIGFCLDLFGFFDTERRNADHKRTKTDLQDKNQDISKPSQELKKSSKRKKKSKRRRERNLSEGDVVVTSAKTVESVPAEGFRRYSRRGSRRIGEIPSTETEFITEVKKLAKRRRDPDDPNSVLTRRLTGIESKNSRASSFEQKFYTGDVKPQKQMAKRHRKNGEKVRQKIAEYESSVPNSEHRSHGKKKNSKFVEIPDVNIGGRNGSPYRSKKRRRVYKGPGVSLSADSLVDFR